MSRQRVLVVLAVTMAALTAGGALSALVPEQAGIPLRSVPQGGSAHEVNGRHVVLVRDGDAVWGFLRQAPGAHGMVSWCSHDEVFLVPSYGTVFDKHGRLMRFLSSRDLDAVAVTVQGDAAVVATDRVSEGRPRIVDRRILLDWDAIGQWRAAHPDRELPTDFCDMSGRAATPTRQN